MAKQMVYKHWLSETVSDALENQNFFLHMAGFRLVEEDAPDDNGNDDMEPVTKETIRNTKNPIRKLTPDKKPQIDPDLVDLLTTAYLKSYDRLRISQPSFLDTPCREFLERYCQANNRDGAKDIISKAIKSKQSRAGKEMDAEKGMGMPLEELICLKTFGKYVRKKNQR